MATLVLWRLPNLFGERALTTRAGVALQERHLDDRSYEERWRQEYNPLGRRSGFAMRIFKRFWCNVGVQRISFGEKATVIYTVTKGWDGSKNVRQGLASHRGNCHPGGAIKRTNRSVAVFNVSFRHDEEHVTPLRESLTQERGEN